MSVSEFESSNLSTISFQDWRVQLAMITTKLKRDCHMGSNRLGRSTALLDRVMLLLVWKLEGFSHAGFSHAVSSPPVSPLPNLNPLLLIFPDTMPAVRFAFKVISALFHIVPPNQDTHSNQAQ
eukprot:5740772-Pleurochrysis_carterae.AAC.1